MKIETLHRGLHNNRVQKNIKASKETPHFGMTTAEVAS